jgi:hypothetical protein
VTRDGILVGFGPGRRQQARRVVGFYIPVERDPSRAKRALAQLRATVQVVLSDAGLSEDELASLFDLRRPLDE